MSVSLEELERLGVVPVVELDDAEAAVELADALAAGGITAAEITFRTAAAANAIRAIARARPDFLVGAGTLDRPDVVEAVVEAGAQFTVSPGFSRQVGEAAARHGLPYIPGVANAPDIQLCLEAGHSLVKLFPVEALGGLRLLRALAGRSTIARRDFAEVTRLASDAAQQVALVRASPAATV